VASVISSIFGSAVKPMDFGQSIDVAAGQSQKAQTNLLSALSNVSTKVNLDLSGKVDASKPGAACLAKNLQAGAVAAQTELRGQINTAFEDIAAAQVEIMGALNAAGMDAAEIFPAQNAASDSAMGEMFSAALQSKIGGGTLATFNQAMSKAGIISDISAGSKPGGTEQAMAEIRDVLVQASQGPVQVQTAGFGNLQDANATPGMESQTSVNWTEVFDGAGSAETKDILKAIMHFNPDNPDPGHFKGLADMVDADAQATNFIAKMDDVIERARQMGTPEYGAEEACYMVQLDKGFANLAFSEAHNPSISNSDIAAIAATAGANSPDKPPVYDNEAGLEDLGVRAANWGTVPTPDALRA